RPGASRRNRRVRRTAFVWRRAGAARERRDRRLSPERRHSRRTSLLHERRRADSRRGDDRRHSSRRSVEAFRGQARHGHMIDRSRGRRMLVGVYVALLGGLSATGAAAQFAHADTAALRRTLDGIAKAHHGVVGYSVMNLDTGEQLSLRGDETFSTASLIK